MTDGDGDPAARRPQNRWIQAEVMAVEADADRRLIGVLHDLRTPLAIVNGFAELLERRADQLTDEQRAEYVARIQDGCREMARLLDEARER